ncbi:VTC domain-containing protein [Umbelopsis sp. PMI_123]|nr:VTC domain-containing protein [Umbelopsis sp. PMI_123]
MVLSWRFYYFDLDRINAGIENNLCTEVVTEEYTKVSDFVKVKLGELQRRIQHASRKLYEQTSLANFIDFERTLDDISASVCDLQLFHTLHIDALSLMRQHINPFFVENLTMLYTKDISDKMVMQVSKLYDSLRASRAVPESPLMSPISLTGETFVSRRNKAWWVHADNSMNLMMHFLKYLSLTTKLVDGANDSVSMKVTSVVLDKPTIPDHSKIVKVQWTNASQEVLIKAMDGDDRTRSIRTKQKYLERWINKEWTLYNLIDKLRTNGYNMEDVEPNARYIQNLINDGSTPVFRTVCNRVTFQSAGSPFIKITIDANLMIQRDQSLDGSRWFQSREDGDDQNIKNSNQESMVRFPFDVIKVSFGDVDEDLPHWWHELIRTKLIQQVPDIYNGIEGLASFIKNDMSSLNAWVKRVQDTANLKITKAHIPTTLTKIRERGSTATSSSNESEGSTVVSISDYKATDDHFNNKGKTIYGSVDLELGQDNAVQTMILETKRQAFVRVVVFGTSFSFLLATLLLITYLI